MELPELIARVEGEALDDTPLARIACAGALSAELAAVGDRLVDHFVDAARREGCSWAQIGSALGVTRQAAHQRHGGIWRGFGRGLVKDRSVRPPAITRFGPDARQAVVEAQNAVRRLGNDHVDTGHLLIGILQAAPQVTARVLSEAGLDRELIEEQIVSTAGRTTSPPAARIPFSPAVKKVLELSLREALALGDRRIGTEHLLLALLGEPEDPAAKLLALHGVDRDHLLATREPRKAQRGRVTGPDLLPEAEFGFPGPLRDRLVAAILSGEKTTTTGLLEEHTRDATEPGSVGQRELVLDSAGRGVAVIELVEVEVKRVGDVDLQFAIDEGEGFTTVAEWRDAHVAFFTSPEMTAALGEPPVTIDDDTLVVCQRFRVVERPV